MIRLKLIALLTICVMITFGVMAQNRGFIILPDENAGGDDFQLYDGSYALLVGVSNYTNGWSDLNQIPFELEDAKQALESHGFEVTLELKRTSAEELPKVFTDFQKKYGYGRNNRLVFIYSGHGHTWEARSRSQGYLVPSDAPLPDEGYPGKSFLVKHSISVRSWNGRGR